MPTPFRYLPSPHCDQRPPGTVLELLVIHAISLPPGQFGGGWVDDLFLGRLDPEAHPFFRDIQGLRVSAHFLVARDGAVTQYVPVMKRAWHAGVSRWRGRERCNDFSVGIELEGDGDTPFTDGQYHTLAGLIRTLEARHPRLCEDHITGHQHIAPGRKWDPGPFFDWDRLFNELTTATPLPGVDLIWE